MYLSGGADIALLVVVSLPDLRLENRYTRRTKRGEGEAIERQQVTNPSSGACRCMVGDRLQAL